MSSVYVSLNLVQRKLGNKLRSLRQERKLTQEKLADIAGVHWTYISGIERGIRNVSLKNIAKIATALGLKPKDIIDF